ncbi:hypothetical protein EYC80_003191 [Monilinia laxa]|uniref:Uncharacterized protein n=1 Tax=Monilinia laxa TaxID=61186 RepID=A0A5N6KCZ5_MONLA|nr:hypothetical protein EYC80_003191 [Monilinia laxa]
MVMINNLSAFVNARRRLRERGRWGHVDLGTGDEEAIWREQETIDDKRRSRNLTPLLASLVRETKDPLADIGLYASRGVYKARSSQVKESSTHPPSTSIFSSSHNHSPQTSTLNPKSTSQPPIKMHASFIAVLSGFLALNVAAIPTNGGSPTSWGSSSPTGTPACSGSKYTCKSNGILTLTCTNILNNVSISIPISILKRDVQVEERDIEARGGGSSKDGDYCCTSSGLLALSCLNVANGDVISLPLSILTQVAASECSEARLGLKLRGSDWWIYCSRKGDLFGSFVLFNSTLYKVLELDIVLN